MRPIFSLFFLFTFHWISAQTITIHDAETGLPIEFVSMVDSVNNISQTTNSKGQINIHTFKNSKEIHIRFLGYENRVSTYQQLVEQEVIALKPKTFFLNPIVVSANRWKQSKKDLPYKISTIKKKDFLFNNTQTAADLLGSSGEVFIQKSQQGGGSPIIRGFSANRLLYSVDGVRMNTAIFRSGNLQNVIALDPFAIENTEVLFGPGSVIYGSDAIGGVMSFTTLTPRLSTNDSTRFSGNAQSRFASANNEQSIHLDINLGLKKWAFTSSITQSDYDDLRMGNNGRDEYRNKFIVIRGDSSDLKVKNNNKNIQAPSAYSQLNVMQKIRFTPNQQWDINYGFHYSTSTEFDRYDRLILVDNDTPRFAEWKYGPQKWMMNNLNIQHTKKTLLYDELSVKLAHQRFEESRITRSFNDYLKIRRAEQVNAYSANIDFSKKRTARHHFFYGLEGIYNQVDSKGDAINIYTEQSTNAQSRYPNSDWYSYAAYFTEKFHLSEKVILHGGLRYNWYAINSTFDTSLFALPFAEAKLNNSALNGNAGLVYQPSAKLIFTFNVSTGFRAPNVDDIGKIFDSEPNTVVVPNPELQEEYAYNIDYNVTKVFGEVLKVDLTLFYTYLENALVRRSYRLNGQDSMHYEGVFSQIQAVQNAAMAHVYGAQMGLEIKLNKNLSISSQLNFQKGEDELEDGSVSPSRHAAPLFGISRLNYQKGRLRLQLFAEYSQSIEYENLNVVERNKPHIYAQDENGNPHSPAWYTLNARGSFTLNKSFSVNLALENITDQGYKPYSSGIAAAGRNLKFGLSTSF